MQVKNIIDRATEVRRTPVTLNICSTAVREFTVFAKQFVACGAEYD
jgi:hypothetical protein